MECCQNSEGVVSKIMTLTMTVVGHPMPQLTYYYQDIFSSVITIMTVILLGAGCVLVLSASYTSHNQI